MAITIRAKRGLFGSACRQAASAGKTVRQWLEDSIDSINSANPGGRQVLASSGAGFAVTFGGYGIKSDSDLIDLYQEFLDIITDHEAAATDDTALQAAVLLDDRLQSVTEFTTDRSYPRSQ